MKDKIKPLLSAAAIALLLNACGSGGAPIDSSQPNISGILVDATVEGAKYTCGSVTSFTGKDGSFFCEQMPVQFYVGSVKLGEIETLPTDGYVTPQDLANVSRSVFDDNVLKIAVFLQSLDDDGDIDNSIALHKNLTRQLDNKHIELQQMTYEETIELLDTIGTPYIVDKSAALIHLHQHTSTLPEHPISTDVPEENTKSKTPDITKERTPEDSETTETQENRPSALDDALQQAYLDIVNEARSQGRRCGKYGYFPATSMLKWNKKLYSAAYEHSRDMALSNTFSHTGSGGKSDETAKALQHHAGSSVGERIEHNGYKNWHRYGENIAAGTSMDEAVDAMEGWLKSPGHCKNIMKPEFEEVGMAVYYQADSHYKYYWTQDFGTK